MDRKIKDFFEQVAELSRYVSRLEEENAHLKLRLEKNEQVILDLQSHNAKNDNIIKSDSVVNIVDAVCTVCERTVTQKGADPVCNLYYQDGEENVRNCLKR